MVYMDESGVEDPEQFRNRKDNSSEEMDIHHVL
jgi:hypothetical protein